MPGHSRTAAWGGSFLPPSTGEFANRAGKEIKMTVINLRDSLLAWYARRRYTPTSEIKPFPYGDSRFGVPKRGDLHFVVLHKRL
jgi:hypothetical protein